MVFEHQIQCIITKKKSKGLFNYSRYVTLVMKYIRAHNKFEFFDGGLNNKVH